MTCRYLSRIENLDGFSDEKTSPKTAWGRLHDVERTRTRSRSRDTSAGESNQIGAIKPSSHYPRHHDGQVRESGAIVVTASHLICHDRVAPLLKIHRWFCQLDSKYRKPGDRRTTS